MNIRRIFLLFFVIALSGVAEAAFTVYLKNGSVITGVSSYEDAKDEIILYIGGGSIGIKKDEIQRIKETGGPEMDIRVKEGIEKEKVTEEVTPTPPPEDDRTSRIKALQDDLDSVTAEIRRLEAEEGRLVKEINEKRGRRFKYNIYQLKQLEKETEPLQQELFSVQQKKNELLERRNVIEGELRTLQR